MPRVMTNPTPVKITTDKINCYATIMRSMISASTAAIRLGDKGLAEMFQSFKDKANNEYNKLLAIHVAD